MLSRLRPSEFATLAILIATVGVAAEEAPAGVVVFHAALLAGYFTVAGLLARKDGAAWVLPARTLAVAGVMFTLYTTINFPGCTWRDAGLERIDRAMFGGESPALWMEGHLTFDALEFFSFIYGFFIPYIYLSILLGCLGRPAGEREEFLTGFSVTYAVAFLGYLLVPAHGPIEYLAGEFAGPLHGGFFHGLVIQGVAASGGNHGAFPSLHVGASAYACLFDLRYHPLRGLTYLPIVFLIAIATIVCRYHYVIDLVAGAALAAFAIGVAPRWSAWGRRAP